MGGGLTIHSLKKLVDGDLDASQTPTWLPTTALAYFSTA